MFLRYDWLKKIIPTIPIDKLWKKVYSLVQQAKQKLKRACYAVSHNFIFVSMREKSKLFEYAAESPADEKGRG